MAVPIRPRRFGLSIAFQPQRRSRRPVLVIAEKGLVDIGSQVALLIFFKMRVLRLTGPAIGFEFFHIVTEWKK